MARGTDQPLSALGPPTARPGRAPHPFAVLLPRHGMLPVQGAVRHIPDSRKWTQIVPQHGLPNPRGPSSDAATDPPPRVSLFRPGPTQRGTLKWASAVRHLTRTKARSPCLPRPSPDPVGWAVPAPPLSGESVCWPSPRQTVTCRPDRRMNRHPSGSDQTIGSPRSMAFPSPAVLPQTRRRARRPATLSSDPPRHCGGPSRGPAQHVTPPCPPNAISRSGRLSHALPPSPATSAAVPDPRGRPRAPRDRSRKPERSLLGSEKRLPSPRRSRSPAPGRGRGGASPGPAPSRARAGPGGTARRMEKPTPWPVPRRPDAATPP